MPVPIVYRKANENPILTFDFYDFSTGTGFKSFYAGGANMSGGAVYYLASEPFDGDGVIYETAINANSSQEVNFDVVFTNAIQMEGTVLINFTIHQHNQTIEFTKMRVMRVRNGVETVITTLESLGYTNNSGSDYNVRHTLKGTIPTTKIGIGDTLRLEMTIYNGGAAAGVSIFHDSSGRATITETGTGATIKKDLVLTLPFKVDL